MELWDLTDDFQGDLGIFPTMALQHWAVEDLTLFAYGTGAVDLQDLLGLTALRNVTIKYGPYFQGSQSQYGHWVMLLLLGHSDQKSM